MKAHKIDGGWMFDTHKYIKALQSKGFKEAQATSIGEIISESREHDMSSLVTKADLKADLTAAKAELGSKIESVRSEIKDVKIDLLKWILPFLLVIIVEMFFKR